MYYPLPLIKLTTLRVSRRFPSTDFLLAAIIQVGSTCEMDGLFAIAARHCDEPRNQTSKNNPSINRWGVRVETEQGEIRGKGKGEEIL